MTRTTEILAAILALVCIGYAAYSLSNGFEPISNPDFRGSRSEYREFLAQPYNRTASLSVQHDTGE